MSILNRVPTHINGCYYNCGGYALETFDWYLPYSYEEDPDTCYMDHYDLDENMVLYMLEEFGGMIRIAKGMYDCAEDERLVAFRCAYDDFHFVKITSDGRFFHKQGATAICEMNEEEFFSPDGWCGGYDGELWFLAIKYNY